MRVRCIHKCDYYIGERSYWVSPEVGEICTANGEEEYDGDKYLYLDEYPGFGYDAKCFAILPDAEPETITEEETLLQTA